MGVVRMYRCGYNNYYFPYSTCINSIFGSCIPISLVLTIKTFVYSKSWTSYSQLFTCFPICLLVDCLLSTCLPAQRQGPYSQGSPLPTDRCAPPVYWYTYLSQCLYSCLFSCSTDNPGSILMMCMMYVSVTLRNVAVMSRRNVASKMWIRRASNTLRPTSASW